MQNKIITQEWFMHLAEEIDAIAVETVFIARQSILEGKLHIGTIINMIAKDRGIKVFALVQKLAQSSRLSERELYYCSEFYIKQEKLKQFPEYSQKNISWNKVKKLMQGKERVSECKHEHVKKITICEDCGKKI